jgi:hypothetical protein
MRGSSDFIASGRHLHTSSLYTSSPCMVILLPPVARPALASALPRRRSLRYRPCQGTAVCDLVALRAGPSRAATPHLHPRTPEPRASLARIALLLTCLKPPCICAVLAPTLSCHSRASMLQRPLCSSAQHLHTPPAFARHRAHARTTRSASLMNRSSPALAHSRVPVRAAVTLPVRLGPFAPAPPASRSCAAVAHACCLTRAPGHSARHCSLWAARLRPGLAPAALARVLHTACSRRPAHALRKPPAPASASSCSLPAPLCVPVRLLPRASARRVCSAFLLPCTPEPLTNRRLLLPRAPPEPRHHLGLASAAARTPWLASACAATSPGSAVL